MLKNLNILSIVWYKTGDVEALSSKLIRAHKDFACLTGDIDSESSFKN